MKHRRLIAFSGLTFLLIAAWSSQAIVDPGISLKHELGSDGSTQISRAADLSPLLQLAQYAPANACCTPYAPCPLAVPMQIGAMCQCFSAYGPVGGRACRL
jgi:hypothetical protein